MISVEGLARRLGGLDGIGVGAAGVMRLAWTPEDRATRDWFAGQASDLGLTLSRDPAGNLWAVPAADPPWWGVGSHLDSVRGGGRFDGPLGVACGFEIAASLPRPVAVLSFADEEGARFNTPTFGSKALAGKLDLPAVLDRRDDGGVTLAEAMRAAGVEPALMAQAPEWLGSLSGFLEIHIDQTTELARLQSPAGVVSSLASRRRLEITLTGRADHAGTTPRDERRDALAAAARLIVEAEEISLRRGAGMTVTTSRIEAQPNAPTTIASAVRIWVDARSVQDSEIDGWQDELERFAGSLSVRSGVEIEFAVASRSAGTPFSGAVRAELRQAGAELLEHDIPEVVCYAGHDAGVIADRVPAAMLLVRNRSGVSHSPHESVELEDAVVAAQIAERALARLAPGAA